MNNLNKQENIISPGNASEAGKALASSLLMLDEKSAENQVAGIAVRAYTDGVLSQPNANFGGQFRSHEARVNKIMGDARVHANDYNRRIQPNIFQGLSYLENYLFFQNAVTDALNSSVTTIDTQIILLDELSRRASSCYVHARATERDLAIFTDGMIEHRRLMSEASTALSVETHVSRNELERMRRQIGEKSNRIIYLEGQIQNIGTKTSGSFIRRVGRVARFFVGVVWQAVIIGVTIVSNREADQVTNELIQTQEEKTELYMEYSKLSGHVTLVEGFDDSLSCLNIKGKKAETAAAQMSMAWGSHAGILGNLRDLVVLGDDPIFLTIALREAQQSLQSVINSLEVIRMQMIGVQAPPADTEVALSEMIRQSFSQRAVQQEEEKRVNEVKQRCIEEVKALIGANS
jgi:hypothetical protein